MILARGEHDDEEIKFDVRFYCFGCHERVRECNYLFRIYSLETAFTCRLCNRRFSSGFEFRKCSLMIDTGLEYACSYCDKNFDSDLLLFNHCAELHSGNKPYECDICDKKFPTKVELMRHKKTHFRRVRSHTCEICGDKFGYAIDLKTHSRIHGLPQRFECKICSLRFKNKLNLEQHTRKHESTKQKYSCDICHQAFSEVAELESHIANHAKQAEEKKKLKEASKYNALRKMFTCEVCGKKLWSSDGMRYHRKRKHPSTVVRTHPTRKHRIKKLKTPVKDVMTIGDVTSLNLEDEEEVDDPGALSGHVLSIPTTMDTHVSDVQDVVDVITLNPRMSFDVPNDSSGHVSTIPTLVDALVSDVVTLDPQVSFDVANASSVQVSTFPSTLDSDVQDVIDVFEISQIPNHVNVCDVAVIPNYVDMCDVCVVQDVTALPEVIRYCGPTEAFVPTALVAAPEEA